MYDVKDWLEIANYVSVIGGVLWAVIQWPRVREQRIATDREHSYAALNDHFLKFLELQLISPALGTSASDRAPVWDELSPQDRAKQRILFDYLASILERAYYFLNYGSAKQSEWDTKQWNEWADWIRRYAQNPNFTAFWRYLDETGEKASYGPEFVSYIRSKIGLE